MSKQRYIYFDTEAQALDYIRSVANAPYVSTVGSPRLVDTNVGPKYAVLIRSWSVG